MQKKYRSGMYGGKFFPFHLGHLMCVQKAVDLCDTVYVILFINGEYERRVEREGLRFDVDDFLGIEQRYDAICELARRYPSVRPVLIDVRNCVLSDGSEDWDAETPLVLNACGRFDAVFSSEPSYDKYFRSAYPWADHILVDPPRKLVPISATMLRSMDLDSAKEWMFNG